MGRRKAHRIRIREERLDKLDETKMEVAIWLLAKGAVEDRTQRSQPSPPVKDVDDALDAGNGEAHDAREGRA